jgi:hypothetical protein
MTTNDRPHEHDPYQTGGIPAARNTWRILRSRNPRIHRWAEIRRVLRIEWRQLRRTLPPHRGEL